MAIIDPYSPEEVKKNREVREKRLAKQKRKKSLALAEQFEEGVSILTAPLD
ncbi:unnamed protein product, partial [marine sediment metagenome]